LISACETGNELETAMDLFQAVKQQQMVPDVITYSASISACEKVGQLEKAMEILETMNW